MANDEKIAETVRTSFSGPSQDKTAVRKSNAGAVDINANRVSNTRSVSPSKSTNHNNNNTTTSTAGAPPSDGADSPDGNRIRWRLECLKSSDTFERIMNDLEVKMVERMRILEALKQEQERNAAESTVRSDAAAATADAGGLLELDFGEEIDEEEDDSINTAHNYHLPRRVKARRAWAIVRRHIREEAMARQNKSSLQWSMLKQTLKNMSNMEAGRENLYKKYLHPSNPRQWTQGIKSIPEDFFARHKQAIGRMREEQHSMAAAAAEKKAKRKSAASQGSEKSKNSSTRVSIKSKGR